MCRAFIDFDPSDTPFFSEHLPKEKGKVLPYYDFEEFGFYYPWTYTFENGAPYFRSKYIQNTRLTEIYVYDKERFTFFLLSVPITKVIYDDGEFNPLRFYRIGPVV